METRRKSARQVALEVLEEVFDQGAFSNIALNKALDSSNSLQIPIIGKAEIQVMRPE